MGKIVLALVALAIAGGAYYLWQQIPTTPKAATFTGYTQNMKNDEDRARAVVSSANVGTIQQAVNKYKGDKGALPASLQDLVPDYLDHVPGGFQYDASTGTVSPAQ